MGLYSGHKNIFLQQSALPNKIIHCVSVRNASNILFNDWALIQVGSRVMRCRSNQLNTSIVCPVVRSATNKSWQKNYDEC